MTPSSYKMTNRNIRKETVSSLLIATELTN